MKSPAVLLRLHLSQTLDYVVTKIPRFTFEKFPQAPDPTDYPDEICR